MTTRRQERKIALDHMIDEKFAEIFFIAKEEYDVLDKSREEEELYDMLETFKHKLKKKCKNHFKLEE
jgi:hypothetical protein|tara:strand:+ start:307 stop:507 length:201 start_codon:yes stop_codon:yes gene_type:complete